MFVRQQVVRKSGRTYTYLKIVENVWSKGKVVQRPLINLGNVSAWPDGKLHQAVSLLNDFLGMDPVGLQGVQVSDCRQLGPYLALEGLWTEVDMDAILEGALGARKLGIPVAQYVRAMVFNRLVDPRSKRAVHEALARQVQMPGIDAAQMPLHGYYRALEYLSAVKPVVEQATHMRVAHLFNRDLSLVFYDLTSSYFEGEGCEMARYGYSREHRPDLVQIEIGLLVDGDGVPIGHEVFAGNTQDGATVVGTLDRLQRDFGVQRCVFVGDDGMACERNLQAIASRGYEYITSLNLRHSAVGTRLLASLPSRRAFVRVLDNLWVGALGMVEGSRYIACYNPDRARTMRQHRKERLRECAAHLRELQAPPKPNGKLDPMEKARRFLARKHCSAFLRVAPDAEGRPTWTLNRAALRLQRAEDGLIILRTNSQTLSDKEVALGYRQLWRVENAFRHIKDPIRLRPIRHWKDPRVLGHVFVCVLAYMLERLLDLRLEKAGVGLTARAALEDLKTITVSTLSLGKQRVRRRSQLTPLQNRILAAVGVHNVPEVW